MVEMDLLIIIGVSAFVGVISSIITSLISHRLEKDRNLRRMKDEILFERLVTSFEMISKALTIQSLAINNIVTFVQIDAKEKDMITLNEKQKEAIGIEIAMMTLQLQKIVEPISVVPLHLSAHRKSLETRFGTLRDRTMDFAEYLQFKNIRISQLIEHQSRIENQIDTINKFCYNQLRDFKGIESS